MSRYYPEWVPCGYTLCHDPKFQMIEFKAEHPGHRGEVRFTDMTDGFVRIEFRGWIDV